MVASTLAVQSRTGKLNMLRAGLGPLKTCGLWTADRQRGTRKEMADGAAHKLMMKAMHPIRTVGREGGVRFTHRTETIVRVRCNLMTVTRQGGPPRLQWASHEERS